MYIACASFQNGILFLFSDGIPVTVYKPSKCNSTEAPAILVYIHGGGNVVGCRKTHETVCKILARYMYNVFKINLLKITFFSCFWFYFYEIRFQTTEKLLLLVISHCLLIGSL